MVGASGRRMLTCHHEAGQALGEGPYTFLHRLKNGCASREQSQRLRSSASSSGFGELVCAPLLTGSGLHQARRQAEKLERSVDFDKC
jgi:hypothetical protein